MYDPKSLSIPYFPSLNSDLGTKRRCKMPILKTPKHPPQLNPQISSTKASGISVVGVLFVPFRPNTTSLIRCILKWFCNLKTFLYQIKICFSASHQGTLLRDIHLLAPNLSMNIVLQFHALKLQRLIESRIYSALLLCISYSNPGAPETTIHSASSTMFLGNRI